MSRLAIQIENRLHAAGYATQRQGGEVSVLAPVFRELPGTSLPVLDHHDLIEIRSLEEAWRFIEQRA